MRMKDYFYQILDRYLVSLYNKKQYIDQFVSVIHRIERMYKPLTLFLQHSSRLSKTADT